MAPNVQQESAKQIAVSVFCSLPLTINSSSKCCTPVHGLCLGKKGSKSHMATAFVLRHGWYLQYFPVSFITRNVKMA